MLKKNISNTLKARLAEAGGVTISWPGVDHGGVVPRLEANLSITRRTGGSLKGAQWVREFGLLNVNVITAVGIGEDAANDLGDAVIALFPEGYTMEFDGGQIKIHQTAEIRGGFRVGTLWQVPVVIPYLARSN